MDKQKVIEIRKMLLKKALTKAMEKYPLVYALICFEDIQPYLVLKFERRPSFYSIDVHDFIYTNYGLDPRIYVVGTINPVTESRLLKECEFLLGNEEEYENDKKRAEEQSQKFLTQFREIVESLLGRENQQRT